jgi:hypothetical protein
MLSAVVSDPMPQYASIGHLLLTALANETSRTYRTIQG